MKEHRQLLNEHQVTINRVIDYILSNLHRNLSLKELAEYAHYSEYHFHRVFKKYVGETVNHYVNRLRLENAAKIIVLYQFAKNSNDQFLFTTIAFECGFSSSANFSKAFKKHYGVTPREFKEYYIDVGVFLGFAPVYKCKYPDYNKLPINREELFKPDKSTVSLSFISDEERLLIEKEISNVKIVEVEPKHVAYVRYMKGYNLKEISQMWSEFIHWAEKNSLTDKDSEYIGEFSDTPFSTDTAKSRYDACITIKENEILDEINTKIIPGGLYAMHHFEGNPEKLLSSFAAITRWVSENNYFLALNERDLCIEHKRKPINLHRTTYKADVFVPIS